MKRIRLGLVLCIALLLTLLPLHAAGAETGAVSVTAGTGTTYYDSFGEAWTAAVAAKTATVKVLKDVTAAGNAGLSADGLDISVVIPRGVTLTMNGSFRCYQASTLRLSGGGTLKSTGTNAAVLMNNKDSLLEIDGCTVIGGSSHAIQVSGGTANILSGDFTGGTNGYGFFTTGGNSGNLSIDIRSGAFRGGAGALNVTGASQGQTPYDTQYLEHLIDTAAVAYHYAGNGGSQAAGWTQGKGQNQLNADYGTVSVEPLPMKLELTTHTTIVVNVGSAVELGVKVTVDGDPATVGYQWYQDGVAASGASQGASYQPMNLKARGTYKFYCEVTYQGFAAQSETVTVTVAPGGDNVCWYTVNGGAVQYGRTLDDALSRTVYATSATSGEIHLMQDVAYDTKSITVSKGELSFFGDGYTLSSDASKLFQVTGGQLNIMNGTIHSTYALGGYAVSQKGGTVTLQGGTILCDQRQAFGLHCTGGTLDISGGTVEATGIGVFVGSGTTVSVRGGQVNATGANAIALSVADRGTLHVSGGDFSSEGTVLTAKSGSVELSGGQFHGQVTCNYKGGVLDDLLSTGYAFRSTAGGGWFSDTDTLSSVSGNLEVLPIPVELLSYTETVDMLVNGYTSAPTLSVSARPRTEGSPLTYQWYRDGEPISGATGASYPVPTGLTSVRLHYVCAIQCEGYVLRTKDIIVAVAPNEYIHVAPTEITAKYGQTLAEVPLPNPAGNSEGEWVWDNPKATVGNSGVNSFAATFKPKLDWIFEPVKVTLSVTVERSSPRLVISETYQNSRLLDKVYNGIAAQQPDTYYISVENGKSDAKLAFRWYDSSTGTLLDKAPINAGSYEVEAYLEATANAEAASARMPVEIRAKQIEPNVILSRYSFTYNAKVQTPTVTVRDGQTVIDAGEYSVRYDDNLNAGTATVTVTDNPGGNYAFDKPETATFDIQKMTLRVTGVTAEGKVYDGKPDVTVTRVATDNTVFLEGGVADKVSVAVTDPETGEPLKGYVTYGDSHADAGSYTYVSFRDVLTLTGDSANNYTLIQPTSSVRSNEVVISKYKVPEELLVKLDAEKEVRFVSNQYPYTYQWPMTVLFPELDKLDKPEENTPMRWYSPQYIWEAELEPAYYRGVSSGTSSGTATPVEGSPDIIFRADKLWLPIGWDVGNRPEIEGDDDVPIGWIKVTMKSRNYEDISYTLKVFANTKVTAFIIDWDELKQYPEFNNQPVRGYDFAAGKNAIGIRPTYLQDNEEPPEDTKDVKINVSYSGRDDTVYRVNENPPTQAGKYRVTASVDKNDKNYIGISSLDFEILKAEPEYFDRPVPLEGLSYMGMPFPLVQDGFSRDGKVAYSLDGKNFSEAIPFGVDVGDYTVYYKILGDRNHKDSEVSTLTATIHKSLGDVVAPRAIRGLTYNGYPVELVTPGRSSGGTMVYSLDGENFSEAIPTAKEVGTYTVYYKVLGDNNHRDSDVGQVQATVGLVNLTVRSIIAESRPYDGSADINVRVEFYENVRSDDLGVQCSAQLVLGESGLPNVGTYDRVNISDLRLTGKDAKNYNLLVSALAHAALETPIEITKASVDRVVVKKYIQIFSPKVYRWSLEELIPTEIPAELLALNRPEFELGEHNINFDEPFYSGGAELVDGMLVIPIDEVDSESNDNRVGSAVITLRFENYEDVNCCFDIYATHKPSTEITGVTSMGRVPYTGNSVRGYNGTPTSEHTGSYDIIYDGVGETDYPSSTQPPVAVGKYSVTIRIPSSNLDMTGSVTLNFEIVRAVPVVKGISDGSVAYLNGGAAPLLSGVSTSGGTLQFALEIEDEDLAWSEAIPTAEEEGDYTVWYRVLGNDSYEALEPASVTVSVKDRAPVIDPPAPVAPGGSSGSAPDVSSGGLTASNIDGVTTATVGGILAGQLRDQISDEVNQPVQIEVSTSGEQVDSLQVTVEAEAMRVLSTSVDVPVTVSTPVADVTLSAEGMDSLAKQDSDLCIELSKADGGVRVDLAMDGEAVKSIPGGVKVTVPCANPTAGTVAVLVGEDGSETLIRKSVTGENSLTAIVDGSAYIKWVENGKRFDDVAGNHWASDAIAFVSSRELMSGTGKTKFSPGSSVTRGMLAQILFNLENAPEGSAKANFADVLEGRWYTEAINWAASEGIVAGYKDNQFRPEASITREQFATMLYRYMGSPDPGEVALDFRDADEVSAYAVPAMRWAVKIGLFTGRTQQRLAPGDSATRAEAAIILQRLCKYMTGVQ